jgi:dTDP-4-amino-4,6-dideoxygalactose transaminase
LGFKKGDFPNAERYYKDALSIPVYPGLTDKDMLYVIDKLKLCI